MDKHHALLHTTSAELKTLKRLWVTRKFAHPSVLTGLKRVIHDMERQCQTLQIIIQQTPFHKH